MKILIALSGIVADICLILLMKALFGHVGMVSALVVLLILWVGNILKSITEWRLKRNRQNEREILDRFIRNLETGKNNE